MVCLAGAVGCDDTPDSSLRTPVDDLPAGVIALLGDDTEAVTGIGCSETVYGGESRRTKCIVMFGEVRRTFVHHDGGWIEEQ